MGDMQMSACQARLMSQAMRKLTASHRAARTACVIFINQIRMKIGVMFGSPGNHDRGQRAEVLRLGPARHPPHRRRSRTATRWSATQTRVKVVKNKVAPPFRHGRIRHHVWRGDLAQVGELIDHWASRPAWSRNRAAGIPMADERIGQGRENAKQLSSRDHPEAVLRHQPGQDPTPRHGLDFGATEDSDDSLTEESIRGLGRSRMRGARPRAFPHVRGPRRRRKDPRSAGGEVRDCWTRGPALGLAPARQTERRAGPARFANPEGL